MMKSRLKIRLLPKKKPTGLHSDAPARSEKRKRIEIPKITRSLKYVRLHQKNKLGDSPTQKRIRLTQMSSLRVKESAPSRNLENSNRKWTLGAPTSDLNSDDQSTKDATKSLRSEFVGKRSSKRHLPVPTSEINIAKISSCESIPDMKSQFQNKRSSNRQLLVPSSEINCDKVSTMDSYKSSASDLHIQRNKKRQFVVPTSEVNMNKISE